MERFFAIYVDPYDILRNDFYLKLANWIQWTRLGGVINFMDSRTAPKTVKSSTRVLRTHFNALE